MTLQIILKDKIYLTFPPLTIVLAGFLAIALVFSDGFSGLFFFLNILLKPKGIAYPEELVPPISEFEWDRLLCNYKNHHVNILS